jgi:predicted MFS family arabinose efflux permease
MAWYKGIVGTRAKPQPLGRLFWRLQGAMLVSSLADGCLLIAPLYWVIIEQGLDLATDEGLGRARDQIVTLLTWVPLARLVATPLLAPLGDALHRGRVLSVALLLRTAPWLALGLLYADAPVSRRALAMLVAAAALSGLADVVSLALVPRLVPPGEVERAVSLSAGLPRAGFFLSVAIGLVVVALFGVRATLFAGAGLLVLAAIVCGTFPEHGMAERTPWRWSPLGALGAGRGVLTLALVAGLANFAVYPLYWVGPALARGGAFESDNLEVAIVGGSIAGLFALGILSRRAPERAIGGTLAALGASLGLLATGRAPLLAAALVGATFAVCNLLAAARAIALAPDPVRTRAAALIGLAFAGGGELGVRTVQPALAGAGPRPLLAALAAPLLVLAILIVRSRRLLHADR